VRDLINSDHKASVYELPEKKNIFPIDAVIKAEVSDDFLTAWLIIEPPVNGGAPPTLEALRKALAGKRIVYGINEKKLLDLVKNPVYNQRIEIARGVAEVNGVDAAYELKFNPIKDLKPKVREDGTIDYQCLDIVENVVKDQLLCTITPETPGTEGMTVTGVKLYPKRGKPAPILLGNNTYFNKDNTEIRSLIDGHVEFINGRITVSDTFYVKNNVDHSTGNLNVNGNIIVRGNVKTGFSVEAKGNIEVLGTVENAKLKAGGNITLRRGTNGSEVFCGGNFNGRFIENSNVIIKGSARTEYIMDSDVRCGKNLEIVGSYARFYGGSLVVGGDFTCPIIGSPSGIKTIIEVGTDSSILERQQEIENNLPKLQKQLQSLRLLISLLMQYQEAGRLDDEKRERLENALYNYSMVESLYESESRELEQIHEKIRVKGYGRIKCARTIYPGTVIKIGPAAITITEPLHNVVLYLSDGRIHQYPMY